MRFRLSKAEKDAHKMMKELFKKPKTFAPSDFKPGNIVLYSYRPKYDMNPYDMSPMNMVLGRSKKYTLCWAINWTPPNLRIKVMNYIMKLNKRNIEKNKPIEIDYATIKKIIKGLGPVIRLYINKRISPKGVVVPYNQYYKVVNVRAEHFIGISAEEAWKMAVINHRKKKRKTLGRKKSRKG